ncbi:MAG: alpha-L-fucosidase [Clostridia bacterium]|nr:alpha-L-fucosidase [Clostridia bacterium]
MLFNQERFGMFIHYGIYSVGAWHEQAQWQLGIPKEEYGKSPKQECVDEWLNEANKCGVE